MSPDIHPDTHPDLRADLPPACCKPEVAVDVDGETYPGKLRSCDQLPDGSWSCLVTVQIEPGQVRTDRVDADRVT